MINPMSHVCTRAGRVLVDLRGAEAELLRLAWANEKCPICGRAKPGTDILGELRSGIGIVVRVVCACSDGHCGHWWWAVVPKENP